MTHSPLQLVQLPLPRRPLPSHTGQVFSVILLISFHLLRKDDLTSAFNCSGLKIIRKFDSTSISKVHKHTFDVELWPEQEPRNPPARREVQYLNDNLVCVLDRVVKPTFPRLQ